MEHISKHLNQVSAKEQQTTESNLSNKVMTNLWERMIHLYAHKFSSVYGESAVYDDNSLTEAARTWASGLRELTGEQIANGLRECIDCGASWPPTLPEFVKMCKGKSENEFGLDYIPECYRQEKRPERLIESDAAKEKHRDAFSVGMGNLK